MVSSSLHFLQAHVVSCCCPTSTLRHGAQRHDCLTGTVTRRLTHIRRPGTLLELGINMICFIFHTIIPMMSIPPSATFDDDWPVSLREGRCHYIYPPWSWSLQGEEARDNSH